MSEQIYTKDEQDICTNTKLLKEGDSIINNSLNSNTNFKKLHMSKFLQEPKKSLLIRCKISLKKLNTSL